MSTHLLGSLLTLCPLLGSRRFLLYRGRIHLAYCSVSGLTLHRIVQSAKRSREATSRRRTAKQL